MTIITTSRKPLPELRSLAKDFSFASGCRYIIRGKSGLHDIRARDTRQIIFSLYRGSSLAMELHDGDNPAAPLIIVGFRVVSREGSRQGVLVKDPSIYERLAPYIPVKLSEAAGDSCVFDGTRSRRYLLSFQNP